VAEASSAPTTARWYWATTARASDSDSTPAQPATGPRRAHAGSFSAYSQNLARDASTTVDTSKYKKDGPYTIAALTQGPGNGWGLTYDVSIEGVSLIANYRAQFNKIIQTAGYKALVQKLAVKEQEGLQADRDLPIKRASQANSGR